MGEICEWFELWVYACSDVVNISKLVGACAASNCCFFLDKCLCQCNHAILEGQQCGNFPHSGLVLESWWWGEGVKMQTFHCVKGILMLHVTYAM